MNQTGMVGWLGRWLAEVGKLWKRARAWSSTRRELQLWPVLPCRSRLRKGASATAQTCHTAYRVNISRRARLYTISISTGIRCFFQQMAYVSLYYFVCLATGEQHDLRSAPISLVPHYIPPELGGGVPTTEKLKAGLSRPPPSAQIEAYVAYVSQLELVLIPSSCHANSPDGRSLPSTA